MRDDTPTPGPDDRRFEREDMRTLGRLEASIAAVRESQIDARSEMVSLRQSINEGFNGVSQKLKLAYDRIEMAEDRIRKVEVRAIWISLTLGLAGVITGAVGTWIFDRFILAVGGRQ